MKITKTIGIAFLGICFLIITICYIKAFTMVKHSPFGMVFYGAGSIIIIQSWVLLYKEIKSLWRG